jgi:aspergillopepsin I
VTGFAIGNGPVQSANISAVADTGATLFHLPAKIADAYYAKVQGAVFEKRYNGWTFPCRNATPDMTVIISGKRVTVPGLAINYREINGPNGSCFGGIQRDFGLPFSLFGDIFMKGQLVIFENPASGRARVGFAKSSSGV